MQLHRGRCLHLVLSADQPAMPRPNLRQAGAGLKVRKPTVSYKKGTFNNIFLNIPFRMLDIHVTDKQNILVEVSDVIRQKLFF